MIYETEIICFNPQKIIKLHRMLKEHELYINMKEHRPASSEEVFFIVSRCQEAKKRENALAARCNMC